MEVNIFTMIHMDFFFAFIIFPVTVSRIDKGIQFTCADSYNFILYLDWLNDRSQLTSSAQLSVILINFLKK